METQKTPANGLRNRISPATVKMITIAILILTLMIPVKMISSLISERSWRQVQTVEEISAKWGAAQTITGPIISVPYNYKYDGNLRTGTVHFLPEDLIINGKVDTMERYRGIYEAIVYNNGLEIKGSFKGLNFEELGIPNEDVRWSQAAISIGITDMRGITRRVKGTLNGVDLDMGPGARSVGVNESGVSSSIKASESMEKYTFSFQLEFNGSKSLRFVPVGESTSVSLESPWPSPSFAGAYLPGKRDIIEGFKAEWHILDLNRGFPQSWFGSTYELDEWAFGVDLFNPADTYQKSERTTKYAILFILVTFVGFFLVEVITKVRIHPIQYALVGFAIIIFYLLLIAVSEHVLFGWAYLASSLAVVLVVSAYSSSVMKSRKFAGIVAVLYSVLYGYLYVLLQMEDYSLVSGSLGVLALLTAAMYLTRNIDWYAVEL